MILIPIIFVSTIISAQNLDSLYSEVKVGNNKEIKIEKKREEVFLASKNKQATLLKEAKLKLKEQKEISTSIQNSFDSNEKKLALLEKSLEDQIGDMGEIFGMVKQSAGDFNGLIKGSLVSVQYPDRSLFLNEVSKSKRLPDSEVLRKLWLLILQEMVESSKAVSFTTDVIYPDGTAKKSQVTRIGLFTISSKDGFIKYSQDDKKLILLPRQPDSRYTDKIKNLANTSGTATAVIDPTRGAILELMMEKATLIERVQQGGLVGYIILILGFVGLLIAIARLIISFITSKKIKKQLEDINNPNTENPLGRILSVYNKHMNKDIDVIESKLDAAILKELPSITSGEPLIKLLAAVAPLLGLLGTVVGMIETFQAITLFGTGDPKLMAGGISQALVTTMLGLIVAVPLLFAFSLVRSRSKIIVNILTQQSAGLVAKRME